MDAKRDFSAITATEDVHSDGNAESNPKRAKLAETDDTTTPSAPPHANNTGEDSHADAENQSVEEDDPETAAQRQAFAEMVVTARTAGKTAKQIFIDAGWTALAEHLPEPELDEMLENIMDSGRPMTLWKNLMRQMFGREPRRANGRIQTLDDAAEVIRSAKNVLVLTGAGISVSCGIPDFRSPGGLYDQINAKYKLPDPQCLFDINYIKRDQRPFFDFALQLYPSDEYKPSPSHKFIRMLEQRKKLLRNYTQNIDTMEDKVGLQRIVQCHGSFRTARCIKCGYRTDGAAIRGEIVEKRIPLCPVCPRPDNVPEIRLDMPTPPQAVAVPPVGEPANAPAAPTVGDSNHPHPEPTARTTTTGDATTTTTTTVEVRVETTETVVVNGSDSSSTVVATAFAEVAAAADVGEKQGEEKKAAEEEEEEDDDDDDDDGDDDDGYGGRCSLADLMAGSLPNSDESDDEAYVPTLDVHAPPDPSTYPSFMKPDIVFFGEPLPEDFRRRIRPDCMRCDLLIVMGSSLRVQPVALVPRIISDLNPDCPQILINRERVGFPDEFDYVILDDCDRAVDALVEKLGWRYDEAAPVTTATTTTTEAAAATTAAATANHSAEVIGDNKDENTDLEEYDPVSSDNDGIPAGYTSDSSSGSGLEDNDGMDVDEESAHADQATAAAPNHSTSNSDNNTNSAAPQ